MKESVVTIDKITKASAKKYARQFRQGRPYSSLLKYAEEDFMAGVEWERNRNKDEDSLH